MIRRSTRKRKKPTIFNIDHSKDKYDEREINHQDYENFYKEGLGDEYDQLVEEENHFSKKQKIEEETYYIISESEEESDEEESDEESDYTDEEDLPEYERDTLENLLDNTVDEEREFEAQQEEKRLRYLELEAKECEGSHENDLIEEQFIEDENDKTKSDDEEYRPSEKRDEDSEEYSDESGSECHSDENSEDEAEQYSKPMDFFAIKKKKD